MLHPPSFILQLPPFILVTAGELLKSIFTAMPLPAVAGLFLLVGLCVGHALFRWIVRLTDLREAPQIAGDERLPIACAVPVVGPLLSRSPCRYRGVQLPGWGTAAEIGTGLLFAGFVVAKLKYRCQSIPEVRPDEVWWYGRIVYHLALIALLIAATGTDLRDCTIPDRIVVAGIVIGAGGAVLSGDLQMQHVWVDWHHEVPGFRGPLIPQWIAGHHHWHGLAYSLAGMAAGAGVTWLVRSAASLILGREAMGLGDVTLMAAIGSFVGWQAALIVLAISPLCGVLIAVVVRVVSGRIFVPFGPFLSLATLCVLFGWKWIWTFEIAVSARETLSVRRLFGDWPSLLILFGIAFAALVVLLGLLRFYRGAPRMSR